MRKLTGFSIVAVLLIALGSHIGRVHAQAPGPSLIYANGPISTCPVLPIPNSGGLLCVANDHVVFAPAGAVKYLQLDGQSVVSAPGTLTLNGTTKALPGPFTISAGTTPITAQ